MYETFQNETFAANKHGHRQKIVLLRKNIKAFEEGEHSYYQYSIKEIGRLLRGTATNHETGETYSVIGFEVKIESKLLITSPKVVQTGFYGIWHSKDMNLYCGVCFYESVGEFGTASRFEDGCGDYIEITEVIVSIKDVNKAVHAIDVSQQKKEKIANSKFSKGDQVNNIKSPEEFGLGTILKVLDNGKYVVSWEDEFGDKFKGTYDESELE